MILFMRQFRRHLPIKVADILLPRSGDRLLPADFLEPVLAKIWCGDSKAPGLIGKWVDDLTLISDLNKFPGLLAQMKATTRREILRGQNEDGVVRVDDWSVDQFVDFQRSFDSTNPNLADHHELTRLSDAGKLSISAAVVDGEPLVAHANILDYPRVRILKGYTKRKGVEGDRYQLVARANKALHYLDMAAYHEAGFEQYDWGGFTGKPDNGIDRFKLQFLGAVKKEVHFRGVFLPGMGAVVM